MKIPTPLLPSTMFPTIEGAARETDGASRGPGGVAADGEALGAGNGNVART